LLSSADPPATGHRRGVPARFHRAGRRPVSTAVLIPATLRRVAPAQTLPRGESGPEAGDGSVAQTCSSVPPRRFRHRFRRVSCLQKQNTGISFRACLGVKTRSQPRRAFCAGAFLMDFLAGYPVLPIQRSILSRPPRPHAPCFAYTVREECDERAGKVRKNEAGKDRDPLHFPGQRHVHLALHRQLHPGHSQLCRDVQRCRPDRTPSSLR